jgi:hypothetical protein
MAKLTCRALYLRSTHFMLCPLPRSIAPHHRCMPDMLLSTSCTRGNTLYLWQLFMTRPSAATQRHTAPAEPAEHDLHLLKHLPHWRTGFASCRGTSKLRKDGSSISL